MSQIVSERIKEKVNFLNDLRENNIYTYCLNINSACENRINVEGRECINFISNNYLGFSTHPKVIEAVSNALKKYGLGIGGSPLMCGTTDIHYQLMEKIAYVYNQEASVIFASGYQALLGSVQASVSRGDVSVVDSLVHRSIIDGVTLSESDKRMWLHNDIDDLDDLLDRIKKKYSRMLIIVDSVYSMDGDIAPLPKLNAIKKKHNALLLIDEAHSLGVLGKKGYGLLDHFDMPDGADVISGTFSKFAGAIGGFVTGNREFIDYVRHTASPYIFSASLSPLVCAGILKSFDLLVEEPEWRERLWHNIEFFTRELKLIGFDIGSTETAVIPIMIRDTLNTQLFNKMIFDEGIYASPVVYPAVSPSESRIRLGIMATHTMQDLEKSLEVFEKVGKKINLI